jgi:glycosyltransferase involved in cell wall biosynthesis
MTTRTNGRSLVSIGVPTFNRARDLERAIRSALSQDYENLEVVVSDNASTDNTDDLCRSLAASDRRIRYLRQATNRGSTANFGAVREMARGEFFMWLGDDDWIDPTYVSKCVSLLEPDPTYSLVCGADRYYQNGREPFDGLRLNLEEESGSQRLISYFRQVTRNGAFYGLARTELISRAPLCDMLGGDWLTIAAMVYFGKIKTFDDIFVHRSLGGLSRDWSSLSTPFSLSQFQGNNPGLTIAANVFEHVGRSSPIYAHLGTAGRLALATRAAAAVFRQFYSRRHVFRLALELASSRGLVR